jgi:hypothetical protein
LGGWRVRSVASPKALDEKRIWPHQQQLWQLGDIRRDPSLGLPNERAVSHKLGTTMRSAYKLEEM